MQLNKHVNPFINGLSIPYKEFVTATDSKMLQTKNYGYKVDLARSVNVYTSKQIREFMFHTLSIYARDMFLAIQFLTNPDYKYVILTLKKLEELHGKPVSPRRFQDTIRELIKESVIDYKDKAEGEYWYNPAFFCSGSRLEMYPECAIKVASEFVGAKKRLVSMDA